MELIRGLHNLKARHRGCVATIGNFDGVHLGHRAVIKQLSEKGAELDLPTTVVIFEPQPLEYFQGGGQTPSRLTRLREKLQALRNSPVARVLCLRFDSRLASMMPDEFIRSILIEGLGVRYLVVGDDFRFGAKRAGDFAMLRQAGEAHGFQVVAMPTYEIDGKRVSSTRIREALRNDDLQGAEKLLGRPYRICGRVAHGDKIGRTLGVPTANVHLHRLVTPLHGIYVVTVAGLDQAAVSGVASIGSRPAVGGSRTLLEVHLLDYNREIYGHYIQVSFVNKLREERNFDSLDELKSTMQQDIRQARAWFDQQHHHGDTGQAARHS